MFSTSCDADGLRVSESRHAVQHARANRHFSGLRAGTTCPQAVACERLEPEHQVLDQRAPVVAAALLSLASAALRDCLDGIVSPARAGRVLRPRRCAFTRRNRRLGTTRGDRGMALVRVVRAVASDGFDRHVLWNLGKQVRRSARRASLPIRQKLPAKSAGCSTMSYRPQRLLS